MGLLLLQHTEEALLDNNRASSPKQVSEGISFDWEGIVELTPSFDQWVDTERLPEENKNLGASESFWTKLSNSSVFEKDIDAWETIKSRTRTRYGWMGRYNRRGYLYRHGGERTTTKKQERTIRDYNIDSQTDQVSQDNIKSVETMPYMRGRKISVHLDQFKPNTQLYAFFDGDDVTDRVYPANGSKGDPIVTDANGKLDAIFRLPDGEYEVGTKNFRLADDSEDRDEFITTYGEATYTANGLMLQKQRTTISTEVPRIDIEEYTETRTTRSTSNINRRHRYPIHRAGPGGPGP